MSGLLALSPALLSAQPAESKVRDRSYDRNTHLQREVVPYQYLREADVTYERRIWREIDVREKMNLPFAWPRRPFISIVLDAAYRGDLTVYNPIDDEFTTVMTPEEVKTIGRSVDTITVLDPNTGEEFTEVKERVLNLDNIKKFRLKEDWVFDKQLSTLYVRVIGLSPIWSRYDESGNLMGDFPMFWVYYPDIRHYMVKEEAFNLADNDGAKLTWDDVLEMRLFGSYVVKETNVYDRFIRDYATGMDALLEGERIRMEIFNWEHDLWEL